MISGVRVIDASNDKPQNRPMTFDALKWKIDSVNSSAWDLLFDEIYTYLKTPIKCKIGENEIQIIQSKDEGHDCIMVYTMKDRKEHKLYLYKDGSNYVLKETFGNVKDRNIFRPEQVVRYLNDNILPALESAQLSWSYVDLTVKETNEAISRVFGGAKTNPKNFF